MRPRLLAEDTAGKVGESSGFRFQINQRTFPSEQLQILPNTKARANSWSQAITGNLSKLFRNASSE